MAKQKPQNKKLTYNEIYQALGETVRGVQQAYQMVDNLNKRLYNLENYLSQYIKFKGREGKRFHRWLEKEMAKHDKSRNEKADGKNLEASAASQGPGTEGVRTQ